MPNYDYKCEQCEHTLTTFQKITESKLSKCPACLQDSLKRLIGGAKATLRFLGSGYYINDYKAKTESPPKENTKATSKNSSS